MSTNDSASGLPASWPILGIASLLFGMIALGMAIIPRSVFNVPPPWPVQQSEPPRPQTVVDGGTSFEVKGVKVTIGDKSRVVQPPAPQSPPVPVIAKTLAIATAVIALLGGVLSSLACWRERSYLLAVPGAGMCCAAILWHYILIGLVFGISILIIVALLSALAGA
jgi:hypothetical protein